MSNLCSFSREFDTADHDVLLKNLEYYGFRGIHNIYFTSYLSNRKQFVSLNGYKSNLPHVKCEIHQGSKIGSLLFLIYMNYLPLAIKYFEVHQFAGDTDLANSNNFVKFVKKQVNHNLMNLANWLKTNEIS